MTSASLKEKPVRVLARLAKQHGVEGWHAMRKDQLIRALVRKAKQGLAPETRRSAARPAAAAAPGRGKPGAAVQAAGAAAVAHSAEVARRIAEARERLARAKNLTTQAEGGKGKKPARDRMVLMVRGPYWLHAFWEVTPRSVERAQSALGQEWHGARPVLRLLRMENGLQASPSEQVIREIEIHGGVKNWFIDIREPMRCRVEVGYRTAGGRFHALARSNAVSSPAASQSDTLDAHWGEIVDDCDRIYSMSGGFSPENNSTEIQELFEERLRRPMVPVASGTVSSRPAVDEPEDQLPLGFQLEVDAEMIVYGATRPDAYVTLQGEPVKVQSDGTFRVRVDLPNKRQVIPIVASAPDVAGRQTIVMAVERNTKAMEPYHRDLHEE
ncbi:MAG: DUF4912 domain-containing protein [Planctomycetota bacterium]